METNTTNINLICKAAINNQQLIAKCLNMGLIYDAKQLKQIDSSLGALFALENYKGGFKPDQQRAPAGQPNGGQWTSEGGGGGNGNAFGPSQNPEDNIPYYDPVFGPLTEEQQRSRSGEIEPVYPIENILAAFSGLQFLNALRTMAVGRAAVAASGKRVQQAEKAIDDYLGGPGTYKPSNAGDMIVQRGGKKVRFDIKDPYPHNKPHFHIQHRTQNGRWRHTDKKRYNFKEE